MNRIELEKAYRETTYTAHTPKQIFDIYIGIQNTEFDRWLQENKVQTWVMLTAANPYSQELPAEQNEKHNQTLAKKLNKKGWAFHYSEGIPSNEVWAKEPSFFILNMKLEEAKVWAESLSQNAIVFGRQGKIAQLIWVVE